MLWVLQLVMESKRTLAVANLDGIDAFGEIERVCIRATLEANPSLHMLIPLFETLYERGNREFWYFTMMNMGITLSLITVGAESAKSAPLAHLYSAW